MIRPGEHCCLLGALNLRLTARSVPPLLGRPPHSHPISSAGPTVKWKRHQLSQLWRPEICIYYPMHQSCIGIILPPNVHDENVCFMIIAGLMLTKNLVKSNSVANILV